MTSLLSLAGDHLPGIGLAPSFLGALTSKLQATEILSMAVRLALIGLCAAGMRAFFTHLKTSVVESKSSRRENR